MTIKSLNRDEFLARFVEGEKKLRVVLLSLQSAKEAIVYDRRTLAAPQIDDWLEEWTFSDEAPRPAPRRGPVGITNDDRRAHMKNRFGKATHLIIASILVVVVAALLIFGMRLYPPATHRRQRPGAANRLAVSTWNSR